MNSRLRKCFLGIVLGYGMILISLLYWQLFADLNLHPANPRYYQVFQQERGTIYDRNGAILAHTIQVGENYVREYATPSLSHVVGYFHPRYGMTGLERLYHEELARGREIITTIDLELQIFAEQILGNRRGAIVALHPKTGEVLALVSSPAIDGNALDQNWSDYLDDLRSPFLNRGTQGLYPPGSVIKPIIYAAALEEKLVVPEKVWLDVGYLTLGDKRLHNYGKKPLGSITSNEALALSSNVVFGQLAISLGDQFLDAFRNFGLGSEVRFELANQKGFVPQSLPSDYDHAQVGIGQGELLVTPLQMAVVAATIANRGLRMRPFMVQELRGGFKLRQFTRPQAVREVFAETMGVVREAMLLAVEMGTAQQGVEGNFRLAAKTGTAQTNQGSDHSWFIGFAPYDLPQVAVAVLVEHGGAGSTVATPIGSMLIAKALDVGK